MGRGAMTTYAALAAASLSLGYWIGSSNRPPIESDRKHSSESSEPAHAESEDSDGNESEDSDSSSVTNEELSSLKVEASDDCKMVLVVRTDLGMSSGKIAAQCSHAALACYKTLSAKNPTLLRQWERTGQAKVTLQCGSEDEMLLLQAQAQSLKLCARSIQDAGRTQIAAGSRTVLGIAGPSRLVNQITSKLRLL
ncbi:hypothetical protein D9613_001624 [Agrocybe pediades]|uniref:peptidyl-tRNA hydrolase n=1 Tax=Agrocybe pediades TaxID=84607 RepID=A0A8H4VV03_9AGAR|nr:hypothetical protein D9613_001624 [Agrocybe pediades]